MKAEKMTPEEIVKFNAKVEYNHCVISWIFDLICIIIATNDLCRYPQKNQIP